MLNTPNEWHNEEEFEEEYADEEYSNEELSEDDYDDNNEEYDEEYEEDDDGSDGGDNGGLKKKLILASAILIIFLLTTGIFLGVKSMSKKTTDKAPAAIENTEVALEQNAENLSVPTTEENAGVEVVTQESSGVDEVSIDVEEEVSIDVEVEDVNTEIATQTEDVVQTDETGLSIAVDDQEGIQVQEEGLGASTESESGLEVSVEETPGKTYTGKPGEETVTIAIGDVGRKNPFAPTGQIGTIEVSAIKKQSEDGVDFEIIEPPQLAAENQEISKLLQTKVTGILFDEIKPSAIINIEGADQLIRIGDVLSGFEIIAITKNKVVIRSDNNVYRASVGQPLNAEKVVNPVEISNLETKFWGSSQH